MAESDDSDEEFKSNPNPQNVMLEMDSLLVQMYCVPMEPRVYPLYSNGFLIEYGFDDVKETEPRCTFRKMLSEWVHYVQVTNVKATSLSSFTIYLFDFNSIAFIWIGSNVP